MKHSRRLVDPSKAANLAVRVRFTEKSACEAEALADELNPGPFSTREDRLASGYDTAVQCAEGERKRQQRLATAAADALLRAAGFKSAYFRKRRQS